MPQDIDAAAGVCVIAHDIADLNIAGHALAVRILQHGQEGLQVTVHISQYRISHGPLTI